MTKKDSRIVETMTYSFDNSAEAIIRDGYPVLDFEVSEEHIGWVDYYKIDLNRSYLVQLLSKQRESDGLLRFDTDFMNCLLAILLRGMHDSPLHVFAKYTHANKSEPSVFVSSQSKHCEALSTEICAMLPNGYLHWIKINGRDLSPPRHPVVINNPRCYYNNNVSPHAIVTVAEMHTMRYAIDITRRVIPSVDVLIDEIALLADSHGAAASLRETVERRYREYNLIPRSS